jgi:hypothetical protein
VDCLRQSPGLPPANRLDCGLPPANRLLMGEQPVSPVSACTAAQEVSLAQPRLVGYWHARRSWEGLHDLSPYESIRWLPPVLVLQTHGISPAAVMVSSLIHEAASWAGGTRAAFAIAAALACGPQIRWISPYTQGGARPHRNASMTLCHSFGMQKRSFSQTGSGRTWGGGEFPTVGGRISRSRSFWLPSVPRLQQTGQLNRRVLSPLRSLRV